jgi:hypothetical protein
MENKDDLLDRLTFRTALIICLVIGAAWLFGGWMEDRFGQTGAVLTLAFGGVLLVVLLVVVVMLMGGRLYRAGAVDTLKGQQITQQGQNIAITNTARALRGEITHNARAAAQASMLDEKRVDGMVKQQVRMLTDAQQRAQPAPAEEVDADYWQVNLDADSIFFER